jgi:hypothetical protein
MVKRTNSMPRWVQKLIDTTYTKLLKVFFILPTDGNALLIVDISERFAEHHEHLDNMCVMTHYRTINNKTFRFFSVSTKYMTTINVSEVIMEPRKVLLFNAKASEGQGSQLS